MYIHSGLSVFPKQGLPKLEIKYFKLSDCGRWYTLIFFRILLHFKGILRIGSLFPSSMLVGDSSCHRWHFWEKWERHFFSFFPCLKGYNLQTFSQWDCSSETADSEQIQSYLGLPSNVLGFLASQFFAVSYWSQ